MSNLIIIGAGGLAREIYDWLQDANDPLNFHGFLSNNPNDLKNFPNIPYPILGDPKHYQPQHQDRFILAIGDIKTRIEIAQLIKAKGGIFETIIHPSAVISKSAVIEMGAIVCPKAIIGANTYLESCVMVNVLTSIGHDVHIGAYSVISPLCAVNGFAKLETGVFLASHVHVAGKKTVEAYSTISANVSVQRSVKPHSFLYNDPPKSGCLK